jgi:hypothetical protein
MRSNVKPHLIRHFLPAVLSRCLKTAVLWITAAILCVVLRACGINQGDPMVRGPS